MKRGVILVVCLAVLAGLGVVVWQVRDYLYTRFTPERCTVLNPAGEPVTLTSEQSRMTSIIVAASMQRELPERAATIALATAYQESGIRNLSYGDRDSLGLFQQRPDPRFEWGSADEIMDPWYSSLRFYEELVKFSDWETEDINDQAQKVQRSGFPEAYRQHVPNATAIAAATRGSAKQAITCVDLTPDAPDPEPIQEVLAVVPGVEVAVEGNELHITAGDAQTLWAATHLAILNTYSAGVSKVQVGTATWELGDDEWGTADPVADDQTAVVTLG